MMGSISELISALICRNAQNSKKMEEFEIAHFELSDRGKLVRIEPLHSLSNTAENDWDNHWINTRVILKAGGFSGKYEAEFMAFDFHKFKTELNALYFDLAGNAWFSDLEGYVDLKIKGDGIGHFEVKVSATDYPGI